MPYFELPDDPELIPYLPYLKLILLHVLSNKATEFPLDKINMPNEKLKLIVNNAIQKALALSVKEVDALAEACNEISPNYVLEALSTVELSVSNLHHIVNNDLTIIISKLKALLNEQLIEALNHKKIIYLFNECNYGNLVLDEIFFLYRVRLLDFLTTRPNISNDLIFKSFVFGDQDTLADLYRLRPQLAQNISSEALCTIYPQYHTCAFYCLASTNAGRIILNNYSCLLANITQEALCGIHPKNNDSAFHWLAATKTGREILLNTPYLLQLCTQEALCNVEFDTEDSPLYWLASTNTGKVILENNLHLLQIITKLALCHICPHLNYSAFTWLAKTRAGQKILITLFEVNQQLATEITLEDLEKTFKLKLGNNTTLYNLLNNTSDGQSVLDKLPCAHHSNDKKRKIKNITSINEMSQQITLNPSTFFQASSSNAMDIVENQPVKNIADQGIHYEDLAEPPVAKR